ncbi:hypothetical protein FF011L_19790 [Roseimaritima multifibrata]|uniref:Uncharacterized protein n=1 Tax=Roseimaritima multifibrata TaxID=1930274 RepID=A0A517MEA9_9BACT|nr:hypothetical protein FF011L_19790 [Roseimaritima multifibrata]
MPSTRDFLSGTAQAVRQIHRVFYVLARRLGPMPSTGDFLSGTAQAVRQIHRVFYAIASRHGPNAIYGRLS